MKYLVCLLISLFVITGCNNVKVYTVKDDADTYLAKSTACAVMYELLPKDYRLNPDGYNKANGYVVTTYHRNKHDAFDYIARKVLKDFNYNSLGTKEEFIDKLTKALDETGWDRSYNSVIATRIADALYMAYSPRMFMYKLRNELKYGRTNVDIW